jgi:CheY-like chemotaxis protein
LRWRRWARQARGEPEIAVACCDVNMPDMDGLTFVDNAEQRYGDNQAVPAARAPRHGAKP